MPGVVVRHRALKASVAAAAVCLLLSSTAQAQLFGRKRPKAAAPKRPPLQEPIVARVNGEPITWRELAEECLARKGVEVLETMIARKLVEQEARRRRITVTAEEVDREITRTARRLNMDREQFLKMIQRERGIPPDRYARDIVWPGLVLKKMAAPHVQVTEEDIQRAYQAHYGEKVKCRWIVVDNLRIAQRVWEELRKSAPKEGPMVVNPGDFERLVRQWSTDAASRSLGGQIQPITHNMAPPFDKLERAAFALKQDYEVSSIIQVAEDAYVILMREGIVPAEDVKLEDVRKELEQEIYEAKLRDMVGKIFQEIQDRARVENLLTGDIKLPHSDAVPASAEGEPDGAAAVVPAGGSRRSAGSGRKIVR